MKRLLVFLLLVAGWGSTAYAQMPSPFPYAKIVPNDSVTGTTLFTLTKINSSGNAIIMATTDTSGYSGVCVANCGKSGSALIAFAGLVPLTVDGTTTASHYILISASTAGDGTDSGATTYPTSNDVIGRVQTASTGGASVSIVDLFPAEVIGSAAGGCLLSNGVNAQTITYALVAGDAGKLVTMSGVSLTANLPAAAPNTTWCASIENLAATALTVGRNGLTINGGAANITLQQYQMVTVWTNGTNYFSTLPYTAGTGITLTPATNGLALSLTNTSTTPNGQTCTLGSACNVNAGNTAHSVALNEGNGAQLAGVGPGTTGQLLKAVSSADPVYSDLPVTMEIVPANCNNATAGAGMSLPTSAAPTAICRTGTNVQTGYLQYANSVQSAQFQVEIPADWDSGTNPYIRINYTQSSSTASQVIAFSVAGSCSTTTDDAAFQTAQTFSTTSTGATANTPYSQTLQLNSTTMTSCAGGNVMNFKIATTGSSTAVNSNLQMVTLTWPRQIVVQAN